MGYTHYWESYGEIPLDKWVTLDNMICYIREQAGRAGIRTDYYVSPEYLTIEGIGSEAHENFVIERGGEMGKSFCKTQRKPYDAVVVAILIYLSHMLAEFEWSSDGDADDMVGGKTLLYLALKAKRQRQIQKASAA